MLINSFYPLPPGGAERQAELLSSYLSGRGTEILVITRQASALSPRRETRNGYQIIRVPQFGFGKMKTLTFTIGAIIAIISERKSFDILHAHLVYSPAFAAVIAGKLIGKKVVVKFGSSGSGSDLYESRTSFRKFVRMNALKYWADCFIVLADEMRNDLIDEGYSPERIVRMFNGVDTDYYQPQVALRKAETVFEKQAGTSLIFTGRLDPSKNLPILLHALKKAVGRCADLHLVLVGDGEERDSLVALTGELELRSCVTFVGLVSNVRDYLQASDIFILPSLSEGNSNSLLEAMSCGLACIATRVGAAAEVLDDGQCGVLIEPNNVDQLADSIVNLVSDPAERKRLGGLARRKVLDNYSINAIGLKYMTLYDRLIEGSDLQ